MQYDGNGWYVKDQSKGFDNEVSLKFAKGFNGKITRIGNFVMAINERYIKEENQKLKLCSSKLQDKNEQLIARNRKLSKLVKKWHKRAKGYAVHNRVLKRSLQGNKNRGGGNLNILVSAAGIQWELEIYNFGKFFWLSTVFVCMRTYKDSGMGRC